MSVNWELIFYHPETLSAIIHGLAIVIAAAMLALAIWRARR